MAIESKSRGTESPTGRAVAFDCLPLSALLLAILTAIPISAGAKLSGDPTSIPRHTGRAAGQILTASNLALYNTVGEVGISSSSGSGIKLQAGFMPLASQPGSITAITALTKATGTLDLAWIAPGRDGFLGDVTNGFYRVDFTSDPTHVFSPTVFQLEFSTTVTAGTTQSLQITGLEPNTTYFTRIYLADARKFFAEDSSPSEESTLANIPVDPVLAAVFATRVEITWALPTGGAAGYETDASSTDFGGIAPGGLVFSSATSEGLELSLTISGLTPNTTYFFKVASLNPQGDRNFVTVLATVTPSSSAPPPVGNLVAAVDPLGRTVRLTWDNPVFANHQGVLVLMSTSPFTNNVTDGLAFSPDQVLSDGAVVKSTALVASLSDSGLALHTTFFYNLFTNSDDLAYSVRVSTAVLLNLAPLEVAGLSSSVNPDRTEITLNWSPVTSSLDGTLFASTGAPRAAELERYEIFRATSVMGANFVRIATLPITTQSFVASIPDPNQAFLYKIEAADSFASRDVAMAVDTNGDQYAFAPDQVTRYKIPDALAREMLAGGNTLGADLMVRAVDVPSDGTDKVVRETAFEVFSSPGLEPVEQFQFSAPDASVVLRYTISDDGQVVPMRVAAARDEENLGIYWFNGSKYVKLFGKVDTAARTVSVRTSATGPFQIRSLFRTEAFHFDISELTNKAITPNGDGLNDQAIFVFDNPKDSAFSGKIFDIRGASVADMTRGPFAHSLQWDGKANGRPVAGGVYIYQIRAENKAFNGTLVVIR